MVIGTMEIDTLVRCIVNALGYEGSSYSEHFIVKLWRLHNIPRLI